MSNFVFDPLTDTTATIVAKVGLAFIDEANKAVARIMLGESADYVIATVDDIVKFLRPHFLPDCDCPMDPYHRWNCELTPIWSKLMREFDFNPWTALWMPPSERDFQTLWRRAGRDPIRHTRMIEGREHTSWYMPSSGLIFETVAPANPPITGMLERFMDFNQDGIPYTIDPIQPQWCTIHSTYHAPGCAL